MGKKSGRNGGDKDGGAKATAFVLRVPMHCRCKGCDDKIRAGVKDLTLHHGIEALDQSALWTKGELRVVSAVDPEKLLRRLQKATGKKVDLAIPKQQAADKKAAAEKEAAMEELLRRSLQQQQQVQYGRGQAAWADQVLPGAAAWGALQQPGGYGYGAAAAQAYPWAVQVPQPEAYPSYHYPATGGAWGAYAYPSVAAQGAYGGGWHGHGAY
ncbi:hypothetical protein GQ55_1G439100 [Panicum hallii var. hallii]|uniref:HMA domain-containing protein n=1 Tax=Panicum hallii var. hallii TaxID=1504633 RepID=A0A2T7FDU1_9POAL|nr:hypothetical protein GQ55_1G439100 [Panicum hallii var. hallii]